MWPFYRDCFKRNFHLLHKKGVRLMTVSFINVHFIFFLSEFDRKFISTWIYYPSEWGIFFIECLLYRDSTLSYNFGRKYPKEPLVIREENLLKTQWLEEGTIVAAFFMIVH